ncbi:DNA polymerase II subunit beta [Klebsiella pneumoniae]|nr:DNA polymerase II subunit beta [Klebsiella pneumoniae]
MSKWNIAAKSPEEQDKVNVDLAASGVASGVAYKEAEHAGCRRRSSDNQVGKGVFNFE